jgi:2-keto-4-pentenoate hydratase/2-oxohepta-3-ene-1,7-dioic acid hydratase in catechol pathway
MGMDPPQFLQSGDVVRIEIECLGAIEHWVEESGTTTGVNGGSSLQ